MTLITRYTTIDKAIIAATGNSLVTCGSSTNVDVNTADLMTLDGNGTRGWASAASTASISVQANSTILYAELIWYSTVFSTASGALDVRSLADQAITLTTPSGNYSITPIYTDSITNVSGSIDRFRSADVTSIVTQSLSGAYTVSKVPISIPPTGLSNTKAGWTLVVIYRNDAFAPELISFSSGIANVNDNNLLQTSITGFTVGQSPQSGGIYVAAANGSPLTSNSQLKVGPSFARLTNIGNTVGVPHANPATAPNNPWNNIFAGQINVSNPLNSSVGLINIEGTNGTNNHDPFVPTQVIDARNKWDLSWLDISSTLEDNQSLIALQSSAAGTTDGIQIVALGSAVKVISPNISAVLTGYNSESNLLYPYEVGQEIIYEIIVQNSGAANADNVIFNAAVDANCSFVPNSVIVNGVVKTGASIASGVNLGTIPAAGIVHLQYGLHIDRLPVNQQISQTANYSYQFSSGANSPIYTNNATTNTVAHAVVAAQLNAVKSASTNTASIGDLVTYNINLTNSGTELLSNLFFQDPVSPYCTYTAGSVTINGTAQSTYDPTVGFQLANLQPGQTTQVQFTVKIQSLPPSDFVDNAAYVTYSYQYNDSTAPTTLTITSNHTAIRVQYVEIVAKRVINNEYPNIGDTVTYTLSLTNIGNIPDVNVNVVEPPVAGATFVSGSLTLNGVSRPELNPFTGFTIASIQPQQTYIITYQVLINQVNPGQTVENIAQVPFKYQITPGGPIISDEQDSNKVITRTNFVTLTIQESVDKSYAVLGDTLYYTVNVSNTGNIDALNTIFLAAIQAGTQFVPNSVAINGIVVPGADPNIGFSLGSIDPSNTVIVTFQAIVTNIPVPNIVYNQSKLIYDFYPDPSGNHITSTAFSNTVQTILNNVQFSHIKSVDKAYAQLGETLVYRTTIQNTGTVVLTNVFFFDHLNEALTFQAGTVQINGINYPAYNPLTGFSLSNISPADTVTIDFQATVSSIPPVGIIYNSSSFTYSYQTAPDAPTFTATSSSNQVRTTITNGSLSITKSTSKIYATVGDSYSYSLLLSNTGNVTLTNIVLQDQLANGILFIPGSVTINGTSKPDYNPNTGFPLGALNAGQVASISFRVTVDHVPTPNTVLNYATAAFSYTVNPSQPPITGTSTSNTVTTIINQAGSSLVKTVNKAFATIGDTLTYTITANNTGTVPLANVGFKDIIPSGAALVAGTVSIDGINYPDYNPNVGFSLANIPAGGRTVVIFQATVVSLPVPPRLDNTATINYQYQLSPAGAVLSGSQTSNVATTFVSLVNIVNTKTVDHTYATIGDTLTYTSVIQNKGNINISDVFFVDSIPVSTAFVAGSVTINDAASPLLDPNIGFSLGTIAPDENVAVSFKVTVADLPLSGYVQNASNVTYQYQIDPTAPPLVGSQTSNIVTTYIRVGSLIVQKSSNRNYTRVGDVITYSLVLANTGSTLLQQLFFQDTIQTESAFVTGTVIIDGVNQPGLDPNVGFMLSDLGVGSNIEIQFQVLVNAIPSTEQLLNTATVHYAYYIDPNGVIHTATAASNQTIVQVDDTPLSVNKFVDKSVAKIGDQLLFTVSLSNGSTNLTAQQIQFVDVLDSNLSFDQGSVTINSVQQPALNPNTGFTLTDIPGETTTTVTFSATVISRPSNNIVSNLASIHYQYILDPQLPPVVVDTITNTTQTLIAVGELTVVKSATASYATIGDVFTYSILVNNSGSVLATSVSLQDIVPSALAFVPGSVTIDGSAQPALDPNVGISLSNLAPGHTAFISFEVKVISVPLSGEVYNTASVTFSYQLTPSDPVETKTAISNTVVINIWLGQLTVTKAVDKSYATIGDKLHYTVTVRNTGNTICTSVQFKDVVQANAAFVPGSVQINGITQPSYDPNVGFSLIDITPDSTVTITFDVNVTSLPDNYLLANTATVRYLYSSNPSKPPVNAATVSNTVTTTINVGLVAVTKSVSQAYATIGDVLTYSVQISNTGNTNATAVNFRDVIPNGLLFVPDSVTINGVLKPGYDPYQSFSLGTLTPGSSSIVQFQATVVSVPVPSLVSNIAQVTFTYRIQPEGPDITDEVNSNTASTQINNAVLAFSKQASQSYAAVGDTYTYSFVLNNTGNVDLFNVSFLDNLQSDLAFVTGSVVVNGQSQPTFDPTVGFIIGTIPTLSQLNLSFNVTVRSLPANHIVSNFATANYTYKIDPNGNSYTKTTASNAVFTTIILGSLTATKAVDLAYATLSSILNYTITVKNTGSTIVSNLFFTDTLSVGANVVSGSVVIDGVPQPTFNPISGFPIPPLNAGTTTTIKFQAQVSSIPAAGTITNYAVVTGVYRVNPSGPDIQVSATTNTVTTQVNVGRLESVKSVDKSYANVGDSLTFTSVVTNTGNVTASNVWFYDTLQLEAGFISGTVRINGTVQPTLDPTLGFTLGSLTPNQSVSIDFTVKINSLPTPPQITNKSQVEFSYYVDPNGTIITSTIFSNTVTTAVVQGQLSAVKSVNKTIATLQDVLTYTIVLTNAGNTPALQVQFKDTPSAGAAFKSGSVLINGTARPDFDPTAGFILGDIGVGNTLTVQFQAIVTSVPASNIVTNQAALNFSILVDPKQPPISQTAYSNTTTTSIVLGHLSVVKSVDKQFATIGDTLTYTIVITNNGNIDVTNVIFIDPTPQHAVFIVGSVVVNGINQPTYNPAAGFQLHTMTPGQIITVVYQVQIIS
ncbi:hypothetical protein MH117_06585 [Paenibacillus sp. ACRRX]|uniref:beta strand repeat-containing protein n=1 Tax=Paenibacillus sp. ACRRX TaxID=2918206 RepID=UPI001EF5D5A1|nr:hypothetical protein [Paenibacillus sp. ACRRX]MCG7407078.1 hypothetical protein [Paenibacillus sp. ACRRX]